MNKREILERSYATIDAQKTTCEKNMRISSRLCIAGLVMVGLLLAAYVQKLPVMMMYMQGSDMYTVYFVIAVLVGGGGAWYISARKKDVFLIKAQEYLELLNNDEFGSITNIALGARKTEAEIIEVFETLKSMNLLNSVIDKASMTIQVY